MTRPARSKEARGPAPAVPPPVSAGAGFAVRARKTIAAPAAAVFAAWIDARRRTRWLRGVKLTVRQATAPKSLLLTCRDDASDISVSIVGQRRSACAVLVHHTRLASAQIVAERRHCWKEMLGALKHDVEGAA